MKSISSLVRAAAVALVALGASALVPSTGSEAQAQYGWSHGGPRVQHHRVAPRHVYRHRHVAPRRVYHRPVVRHYAPRYRAAYYAPRYRPVYAAPVYYGGARRCVIEKRWVHTHYGPQRIKQRVCYRGW